MEITYHLERDYLLPNLLPPPMPPMGKYARLRLRYLKEYRPAFYASLLLSGKIDEHLAEVENASQAMMDSIMSRLKKERGITEELKANDQMQWVAEMENVRMGAEETVMNDLIWL